MVCHGTSGCDFFRKYADMQISMRTCRNLYFQMLVNIFRWCLMIISCFFVILLSRRYADKQIRRYADRCSRLLAIDACLLSKIVFLLSRMSTKIDFCGATGHDHGGWQVAAADGDGTTTTITTTMAATVTMTVGRGVAVAV